MAHSKKAEKILVAIPFYSVTEDFEILIEEGWSFIDTIFMRKIVDSPCSMDDLIKASNLPRQLVIQIIMPLIRVGWVEIIYFSEKNCYVFSATESGKRTAKAGELPSIKNRYTRRREYLFEPFNGECFKSPPYGSSIRLEPMARIRELDASEKLRFITLDFPNIMFVFPKEQEIYASVKKGMEQIIGLQRKNSINSDKKEKKYVIVRFIKGSNNTYRIDGDEIKHWLGKKYLSFIESKVNDDLKTNLNQNKKQPSYFFQNSSPDILNEKMYINPKNIEFIYGGEPHQQALFNAIQKSLNYLIIHITFISERAFREDGEILNELKKAAKRGVYILIMWGKDDLKKIDEKEITRMRNIEKIFEKINNDLKTDGVENFINLNPSRTGSHAKYILYDTPDHGCYSLVGSCNFFYSNFDRFEASVLIKDVSFSIRMLEITVYLSAGRNGIVKTSNDLKFGEIKEIILSRKKHMISNTLGEKNSFGAHEVNIVLKGQHYNILEIAKNMANKKIFLCSDKINPELYRPIWDCLKAKKKNCKVEAFYSNPSDGVESKDVLQFANFAKEDLNLSLKPHAPPNSKKNHSKVLFWDSDHIVITSLNWFSSNASSINTIHDNYHEIGVYIKYEDVATKFYQEWLENSKFKK